jgi:hypothetical protein
MLRKGRNALLIATGWSDEPGGLMLEIGDENGMPLAGIGNDVGEIVRDFAVVSRSVSAEKEQGPSVADDPREVTFRVSCPDASEVSLIGEFNNWSPEATPMKLSGGGMWSVTVTLPPGTYSYKFLVDRKRKITDPSATGSEPDGFGGTNSVRNVR